MKDAKDPGTVEIAQFPLPSRRGRRPTGNAKTNAQRQAEWRAKRNAKVTASRNVQSELDEVKALRDRIAELETALSAAKWENFRQADVVDALNRSWRGLVDEKVNENLELGEVLDCIKTGRRPLHLVQKGYFIGLKKRNVTKKEGA